MTPKDKTFRTPEAALENAKRLFAAGDISKEEFALTAKKLQEAQLSEWLGKKYPKR